MIYNLLLEILLPGIMGIIMLNRHLGCWYASFAVGVCVYYIIDLLVYKRYNVHMIETYLPMMNNYFDKYRDNMQTHYGHAEEEEEGDIEDQDYYENELSTYDVPELGTRLPDEEYQE